MGQSGDLATPEVPDCPVCEGPCTEHPLPDWPDGYRIGDPMSKHPKNRTAPQAKPRSKRGPVEDRARRLAEDR